MLSEDTLQSVPNIITVSHCFEKKTPPARQHGFNQVPFIILLLSECGGSSSLFAELSEAVAPYTLSLCSVS